MTRQSFEFSLHPHEEALTRVIEEVLELDALDPAAYEAVLRRHPKEGGGFFSKSEVIRGFRHLNKRMGWNLDERPFVEKLRMKPVRTQSGVAPVTVLTKPYPCPGRCIFCPSDVQMPKSYISSEPGAQRAAQHQFDPFAQTASRLHTYHNIGHDTDKVELIILGGTWSSYPEPYQIWFVTRCLEAMNRFSAGTETSDSGSTREPALDYRALTRSVDGNAVEETYNEIVTGFLRDRVPEGPTRETATWTDLEEAQRINETATARCVGLVAETRPDHLDLLEVLRLRRLGTTKVQIGYQSLSDEVLQLNHRGHDVAATRRAMHLLRQAGFKIHAHWMPNLYGSTPERDIEDFERIFADPDFRPDELKIYPCSLVETAELMAYYRQGKWQPYSSDELLEVVTQCMARTPQYCRLTRVVRDIPGTEIVAGSRVTNLRQIAERSMRQHEQECVDIRSREIRHRSVDPDRLELDRVEYRTSLGKEIFLQFVTESHRIAAFLRLSLPSQEVAISEIRNSAMIREIHVYGLLASLGQRTGRRSQHLGLGKRLIEEAVALSTAAGFSDLAVISAIGTREYYRANGFRDGDLYQHCELSTPTVRPAHG